MGSKRQLESKIIRKLGWKPKIGLETGLKRYFDYYLNKFTQLKKLNFF